MEKLLTPKQVASILKISISTVRRLYRDGELQCLRLGHRTVRLYRSDVENYLKRNRPTRVKQIPEIEPVTINFEKLPPAGVG